MVDVLGRLRAQIAEAEEELTTLRAGLRVQIAETNEERQNLQQELTEVNAQMTVQGAQMTVLQKENTRLGRKLAKEEEYRRCQEGELSALSRCTDERLDEVIQDVALIASDHGDTIHETH